MTSSIYMDFDSIKIGAMFGKLTLLKKIDEGITKRWRLKCSCGNEVEFKRHELLRAPYGRTSCGKCGNRTPIKRAGGMAKIVQVGFNVSEYVATDRRKLRNGAVWEIYRRLG
jgi:hypothetical protein